jgi:hypothetical protein
VSKGAPIHALLAQVVMSWLIRTDKSNIVFYVLARQTRVVRNSTKR